MAKKVLRKQTRQIKKAKASPFSIYWEKQNYYLLILGLIIIAVGYYFMTIGPWNSFSSLVISPIILFIGYVVIFPLSIFLRKRSAKETPTEEKDASGQS